MKIIDLIKHYDRAKGVHQPISKSLNDKLVQLMDAFGDMPADASGLAIGERAKQCWPEVKPNTMARHLGQLRAVLKAAERDGLIVRAPHLQMPSYYDVVDVPITVDEAHLLMRHLRFTEPRWWGLAMVLLHTGGRPIEVLRLTHADLTGSGVVFRKPVAHTTKTIQRTLPYTRQLREAVGAGLIGRTYGSLNEGVEDITGPLFRWPGVSNNGSVLALLGRAIKGACRDLGLPEIRPYDLRHLFAGIVAEQGGDLADIAALLGHTNPRMAFRYRGLVAGKAKRLLENV